MRKSIVVVACSLLSIMDFFIYAIKISSNYWLGNYLSSVSKKTGINNFVIYVSNE